ncbi:NUDIX hydrolase [Corynebacterium felinum]|uniref:8-oxo-dGTP pyrophosphatase MutT (NUDIX family) n=1 Tax=Corynebacterium felinum TaxID=131318 RepID=A0ABU2B9Q6_9CORY|nr:MULTISPECIES: NUDIX hydrolase [Corynebacterium]MDF5821845.1 NUDIX hydrolase [Corynebacterium felinum]MDO4760540.1 NUDIX hydrolase [Corynebacterium sp.]MDR7355345.1 8-oxo-dGTP pyrophosphatase MutT (NUDIX family) [Corynebacterium felinum]WJY94697.1 NUDIX domain protein [Corynebacterium felinum]
MSEAVVGYEGAKLAVTVVMVRDTEHGLEVYVQERVSSMPTFPNATVFPGGGVDSRDVDATDDESIWFGPTPDQWSQVLGTDRRKARALVMAAGRELFEESGTLLASHLDGSLIADATPYHSQRLALESHRLSFSQVLKRNDLVARSDLLHPCSRWVSPEEDAVKFDMYSFIAQLPDGQEPDGCTREAASTGWFSPSLILDGWRAGLLRLVIPTWAHLLLLSQHDTVASLLAALENPVIEPVLGNPVDDPRYAEFFNYTPPNRLNV